MPQFQLREKAMSEYEDDVRRMRERESYLRVNHPKLMEIAIGTRERWQPISPMGALVNHWANSWIHSDETIEAGLARLCLVLAEQNSNLSDQLVNEFARRPVYVSADSAGITPSNTPKDN